MNKDSEKVWNEVRKIWGEIVKLKDLESQRHDDPAIFTATESATKDIEIVTKATGNTPIETTTESMSTNLNQVLLGPRTEFTPVTLENTKVTWSFLSRNLGPVARNRDAAAAMQGLNALIATYCLMHCVYTNYMYIITSWRAMASSLDEKSKARNVEKGADPYGYDGSEVEVEGAFSTTPLLAILGWLGLGI